MVVVLSRGLARNKTYLNIRLTRHRLKIQLKVSLHQTMPLVLFRLHLLISPIWVVSVLHLRPSKTYLNLLWDWTRRMRLSHFIDWGQVHIINRQSQKQMMSMSKMRKVSLLSTCETAMFLIILKDQYRFSRAALMTSSKNKNWMQEVLTKTLKSSFSTLWVWIRKGYRILMMPNSS